MPQSPSDDLKVGIDIDAIEVPGDVRDAMDINTKVHTRVIRKLDWHLLPLVCVLQFLALL